eukprot:m.39479 g.39479  ORF g.39479 m.39479 type:complete len:440 (+) comp13684_c0_seq1:1544-2863(+)
MYVGDSVPAAWCHNSEWLGEVLRSTHQTLTTPSFPAVTTRSPDIAAAITDRVCPKGCAIPPLSTAAHCHPASALVYRYTFASLVGPRATTMLSPSTSTASFNPSSASRLYINCSCVRLQTLIVLSKLVVMAVRRCSATPNTHPECVFSNVCVHVCLATLHTRTTISSLTDTNTPPRIATLFTAPVWPTRTPMTSPVSRFHNRTVISELADAIIDFHTATPLTESVCPLSVWATSAITTALSCMLRLSVHTLTVWSRDDETTVVPDTHSPVIPALCSWLVAMFMLSLDARFHTFTTPTESPETTTSPSMASAGIHIGRSSTDPSGMVRFSTPCASSVATTVAPPLHTFRSCTVNELELPSTPVATTAKNCTMQLHTTTNTLSHCSRPFSRISRSTPWRSWYQKHVPERASVHNTKRHAGCTCDLCPRNFRTMYFGRLKLH